MADFDEIHKQKLLFSARKELALRKNVTSLERKLFELILADFISKLEVTNGIIDNSGKNVSLVNSLDKLFKQFNSVDNAKVVSLFAKDLLTITSLNEKYFNVFATNKNAFKKITKDVESAMFDRLGLTAKRKIKKGGYLDNIINDTAVKNIVKDLSVKAVTGSMNFSDFKNGLRDSVVGVEKNAGLMQKHYRTFAYDTYQEYDNTTSFLYATELKMQSFIYTGGIIGSTRKFCCQRNGKIWTIKEAEKWKSLTFSGKPKSYNPLTQLGGHNCRHTAQYIPNDIAAARRSDLAVNAKGELIVVNNNVKKQMLNKC